MSATLVETFRANNTEQSQKYRALVQNKLMFNLFLIKSLPMGYLAGLKVVDFTPERCSISVPYRWMNQNPFRCTYFAVLAMAAEMSSGMIAMMHTHNAKPSVSMLVTNLESQFVKKATGLTVFTCEDGGPMLQVIEECVSTGEGRTYVCTSTGRNKAGEVVATFRVTWSFKARSK
ncbi:MAG: PaaI family thioesterase [Bacteroidetes bacterium]|nr:PaaI family thioesterase [Bacteroidota bacterium]